MGTRTAGRVVCEPSVCAARDVRYICHDEHDKTMKLLRSRPVCSCAAADQYQYSTQAPPRPTREALGWRSAIMFSADGNTSERAGAGGRARYHSLKAFAAASTGLVGVTTPRMEPEDLSAFSMSPEMDSGEAVGA